MLELRSIHAGMGGFLVLRDVSFALEAGKTTVLVGRNGAGKTTTLRAIMGLVPVDSGSLMLDGINLLETPAHGRAALGMGYAPEDRRLIASFTVEENLLLPMIALRQPARLAKQRLAAIYALMPELADLRERPGGYLSGGEGKMVALGRALMVGTRIVLLDEPFQGLAPGLATSYASALHRVREQRKDLALLITESSPRLVRDLADCALRIERGVVTAVPVDTLVQSTSIASGVGRQGH
jgi:ABC-type branched-subunit amino acid transport system ATPase component